MNINTSNNKVIALSLLVLCLVAVLIGMIQMARTTRENNLVRQEDGYGSGLLSRQADRLVIINLDGMIMEELKGNSLFAKESSAMRARRLLYEAAKDTSVKGVLLRINSPGGTVGMSQELYDAVLAVRQKKPIVASMGDLAASGAYYTAAATDKIVANPGTLTASIGVIIQSVNAEGLLTNKLDIKPITIKSGKFKDILSPYRAPTSEDTQLVQHIINTSYHQFLNAVIAGRTMGMKDPAQKAELAQRITAIADGRVVIGEDAQKIGLVDELGGLEKAKSVLRILAGQRFGISKPSRLEFERYSPHFTLWQLLSTGLSIGQRAAVAPVNELGPESLLPPSLRYANQPLWMMETFR